MKKRPVYVEKFLEETYCCSICGAVPAIYRAVDVGFCKEHKIDAVLANKKNMDKIIAKSENRYYFIARCQEKRDCSKKRGRKAFMKRNTSGIR